METENKKKARKNWGAAAPDTMGDDDDNLNSNRTTNELLFDHNNTSSVEISFTDANDVSSNPLIFQTSELEPSS